MLLIISKKDFEEKPKSFVKWLDYNICDAVDDSGESLNKYGNHINARGLAIPKRLYKLISFEEDDDFDDFREDEKIEELWKRFRKSREFRETTIALFSGYCETLGSLNLFIVIPKKAYKKYAKKLKKAMCQVIKLDPEEYDNVIMTYDELRKKKELEYVPKEKTIKEIKKLVDDASSTMFSNKRKK